MEGEDSMRTTVLFTLVGMLGLFCSLTVDATPLSCCDMPEPITNCACACTLPKGDVAVRYLWEQGSSSELLNNGHPVSNPMAMKMLMTTQQFEIKYGIRDDLQLCTTVPYVDNTMYMTMMGMTSSSQPSGIGDVTTLMKYRLNSPLGIQPIFAIGGGVKWATGKSGFRDQMGDLLPLMMQPGTGTTDALLGAWASMKLLPWAFHGGVMYEFGGADHDTGLRHGNAVMSNWTACYSVTSHVVLLTELNYSYMTRDHLGGVSQTDTGGTTVSLTPGLQYQVTTSTDFEAAYQLPFVSDLHGSQLKPVSSLVLGVRRRF
jgi:hypothetical protein